jgi:hypothetical protein
MDVIYQNADKTSVTSADRERKFYAMNAEGNVNVEDFKGGFNAVLADIKESQFNIIVLNLKKVKSTPMVGRTWLLTTYLPELYKTVTGKLQIGIINSDSFFEGTTISILVTSIQALGFDLGIKFFKTVEDAEKALLTPPTT